MAVRPRVYHEGSCAYFLSSRYNTSATVAYYAGYILFLVLTVGVFIYGCVVRSRAVKIKALMLAVLGCMTISRIITLVTTTLSECRVLTIGHHYNLIIANLVISDIGYWLLLLVQVWGVNSLLSRRHDSNSSLFNIITVVIVVLMGVLTAAYMGVSAYNRSLMAESFRIGYYRKYVLAERQLSIAYWALYLASVLGGAAISAFLVMKMRSRNLAVNGVTKHVIAIAVCMTIWVIFALVQIVLVYEGTVNFSVDAHVALWYIENFFLIGTFIAIIGFSKLSFWSDAAVQAGFNHKDYQTPAYAQNQPAYAQNQFAQQQYGYGVQPGHQHPAGQQPVYNGPGTAAVVR